MAIIATDDGPDLTVTLADPGSAPTAIGRSRSVAFAGILACVLLGLSLSRFASSAFSSRSGWALYVLALVAAGAAVLPFRGSRAESAERVAAWELAALGAVLAGAAALRLHDLSTYPWGIWVDEAENTLVARRILEEPRYAPVFVAQASKMPALAFYFFAPFVKLFTGRLLGVRVATAVAGILAVAAVWLLGREIAGPRVAILAAAFVAVSRWHLGFSRFGMAMVFTTLVPPIVFFLALRAQRRASARDAVWAGLALGLGVQLYYSMVVLPLVLVVPVLRGMFRPGARRARAAGLLVLTLAAAAFAYAPLGLFARRDPEHFAERFRAAATLNVSSYGELARLLTRASPERAHAVAVLTESLRRHALMFHVKGDVNGRHNLPNAPMLDPVTGGLFAAGFVLCLGTLLTERSLLLLLWFSAFMAAGVLSVDFEAPQAGRTLGVVPVVALMAALPLAWVWKRLEGTGSSPVRSALAALVPAVVVGAAGVHTANAFFRLQRQDPGAWAFWSTQETKVGRVVRAEGADAAIFIPPPFVDSATIHLILGRPLEGRAFFSGRDLPLETGGRRALVFLTLDDPEGRANLARLYPHARFEEFGAPSPSGGTSESILTIARVPLSDIEALQGWHTSIAAGGEKEVEKRTPRTVWDWSEAGARAPFEARVRGRLRVVKDGIYRLVLATSEPARLSIDDGDLLTGTGRREVLVALARGTHDAALDVSVMGPGGRTALTWVAPDATQEEPIPPADLFSPLHVFGGLLGSYYHGAGFDGTPVFQRIDPNVAFYFHEIPVARPFAIRWTGSLQARVGGTYRFSTKSIDDSTVRVDGRLIVQNPGALATVEGSADLTRGAHALEVTLRNTGDYGQIYLSWTPPGGATEILPVDVLRPPPARPENSGPSREVIGR